MDELPEYLFHKKRANIVESMDVGRLFKIAEAPESMRIIARKLVAEGWTFQTVQQKRGRCYYKQKVITIPLWVIGREPSKIRWYICHEMSHAIVGGKHGHNEVFMYKLKEICPIEDQHWEHGYKPRNAASAGLSEIGSL